MMIGRWQGIAEESCTRENIGINKYIDRKIDRIKKISSAGKKTT